MKNILLVLTAITIVGCNYQKTSERLIMEKVKQFAEFELKADLSVLSDQQKQMLPLLFEAADIMDDLFWLQAYGNKQELLDVSEVEGIRRFIEINYGPWERLNGNTPFIPEIGVKPKGANFYPADMTEEDYNAIDDTLKSSEYSIIRRSENGQLNVIPYREAYSEQLRKAATLLKQASSLAEDAGFKKYLELRADALLTDNYQPSDIAWMDMKSNQIDFVVGPIENYEDQLYGKKAAFEAYILLKDLQWSEKLNKYAALLPALQKKLPVSLDYKAETPGSNSDLAAYDVLYYAGDCNAGGKTIAINLPNDEEVQLQKGSRRLQLKNAMQAKFDKILVPIAHELIVPEQHSHISFDAFFGNTMFHEVAHGLGIKNTITNVGTVREALKDEYLALEEGKADILGLFLVEQLIEMDEWDADIMDHYTTFLAGIFRSIRFGSSSAHGVANLVRLNFFKENGAFERNENGLYKVNPEAMNNAINKLSGLILVIQGNGDYEAAAQMINKYGFVSDDLKVDLERINSKGIPVDIVFKQGPDVLGLN